MPGPTGRAQTMDAASLSQSELLRYSRQLALPELGVDGQRQLARGKVLIVGAGGLGSPAAMYLAAVGVGTLGLVDFDTVDIANLHRQLLYRTDDIGQLKVEVARRQLHRVNPHVDLVTYPVRMTAANAMQIIRPFDVVVDGTDNFSTRYLVNDACVLGNTPNVYASVLRFAGQVSILAHPAGPCYRCLYPEPPPPATVPSCAEAGVLGVLPGLLGMLQAIEAIKLLTGIGNNLVGRLLLVDAMGMRFREMRIPRNSRCVACGTGELRELIDYDAFCGVTTGGPSLARPDMSPPIAPPPLAIGEVGEVDPQQLEAWRSSGRDLAVVDVRESWEWAIGRIPGASHIPLGTLARGAASMDPAVPIVLYCHHGARSLSAAEWLAGQGFAHVWNLTGGIDRYSREVDPAIPRY
ncbi:MAG: molybdopterin-synthase adenylyltransferase MoeB [Gemmatimonadaceae bacterium]